MGAVEPSELVRYARIPLEPNIQAGEEVLIVTDTSMEEAIPKAVFLAAQEIGAEPSMIVFPTRAAPNMEPSRAAAAAMKGVDVLVVVTTYAFLHTEAMRAALATGLKYISFPGITIETMTQGAATADPRELLEVTERVAALLTEAKSARVTSALGTDVVLNLEGREGHILVGQIIPGKCFIGGFPFGEAPIAPVEQATEGTIVFDSTIDVLGKLSQPVSVRVERGRIISIEGAAEAAKLRDLLASKGDESSYLIGEFAIGTNPKARLTGHMMEDKRIRGSVHFGLGDNASLGGNNRATIHMDALVLRPTVVLDGRTVVEDGVVLTPSG